MIPVPVWNFQDFLAGFGVRSLEVTITSFR